MVKVGIVGKLLGRDWGCFHLDLKENVIWGGNGIKALKRTYSLVSLANQLILELEV